MKYHYEDENLGFLIGKINDIKIARFKSEINTELKLPNNIIETLKVENDGTIWFFTSCYGYHAESIDKSFYAYLDYYKKGRDCRLQLSGKATIVEDDHEDLFSISNYSTGTFARLVLIKMKIMQVEYFELTQPENLSWQAKIKTAFSQLFLAPSHRIYDFS